MAAAGSFFVTISYTGRGDDEPDGPGEMPGELEQRSLLSFTSIRSTRSGDGGGSS